MSYIPIPIEDEIIEFQGNILEFVSQKLKTGEKIQKYEWVRRTPGVRIIVDDIKNGKILLSYEYRQELNKYDYRLAGGKVFNKLTEYNDFLKSGKDIAEVVEKAVINEALEEIGVKVNKVDFYQLSKCGTTIIWDLFYFFSTDFDEVKLQKTEDGEEISTKWFTYKEIIDLCLNGEFSEDRSMGVILKYILTKDK